MSSKVDMLWDMAVVSPLGPCAACANVSDPRGNGDDNSIEPSTLLYQRGSALADFFKCRFDATKLLRAQFREHSLHLPGMLSKGSSNEVLAACGEGHDPHAPVFSALDPANQALRNEAVDSNTDRAWGQIDDRAYRIDGQSPFVQQGFQHAEIRKAEPGLFNTSGCVPR